MLTKTAETLVGKSRLLPQQQRVVDRLARQRGVVAVHGLGSGKTLTMLAAAKKNLGDKEKGLFIVPASLVNNIHKEMDVHGLEDLAKNVDVVSYESAARDPYMFADRGYKFVALDEAHKIRNVDSARFKAVKTITDTAQKVLLATATPAYNKLENIAPLVNISAGRQVLPEGKKFKDSFLTEENNLKNVGTLRRVLREHVDYHQPDEELRKQYFPQVHEEVRDVDMTPEQWRLYKYFEGKIPPHLRKKIQQGLPLDKRDKTALNMFATAVRQVSGSTKPYVADSSLAEQPKIDTAIKDLKQHLATAKSKKALIYSNFVDAVLNQYSDQLKQQGVEHGLFTGKLSKNEKNALIQKYNDQDGKPKVLLVSSSGGEGLDLKGTSLVQVLEPHFNKSKIQQVVGRAARFKSHEHLPEDQRSVQVVNYLATPYKGTNFISRALARKNTSVIDHYLYNNSDDKDALVQRVNKLLA